MAGEGKINAVFLDVNMPTPESIERTRKIRPGGLNVSTPIMMITGEDDRALLGRAFEAAPNFSSISRLTGTPFCAWFARRKTPSSMRNGGSGVSRSAVDSPSNQEARN